MFKVTLCRIGIHRFLGSCTCVDCKYTRESHHSFYKEPDPGEEWISSCACIYGCGFRRNHGHHFISCFCSDPGCDAKAPETSKYHSWDGCTCMVCGLVRDREHDWTDSCICKCGKIAPYFHISHKYRLSDCKCEVCNGKAGPYWPHHEFIDMDDNGELIETCRCRKCGQFTPTEQTEHHKWGCNGESCICLRCNARNPGGKHLRAKDGHCSLCGDGRKDLIHST